MSDVATREARWSPTLLVALLALALFAVRVSGPVDLMDNDQLKPAHYVHDALLNGSWIVQRDTSGDIASKPPLQVWLGAIASAPLGRAQWWTLAIPSLIGVVGIALLAQWWALRLMPGRRDAATLAGVLVLCSIMGTKQVALVRTDALFGATVGLGATLVFLASRGQRSWLWFWCVGALVTLTKGPLGVLIASLGLLARPWRGAERPTSAPRAWRAHAIGVALFFVIAGGWALAAYLEAGQPFLDKVLGRELVGHAVSSHKGEPPGVGLYKSPSYWLWFYAPAAPLALAGLWVSRRLSDPERRCAMGFLALWLLVGLAIFSIAPHQRPDLLTVLWVPTGAFAAVGGLTLLGSTRERWAAPLALTLCLAALIGTYAHRHHLVRRDAHIVRAALIETLALDLSRAGWSERTRSYSGHSYLDFVLGRMDTRLTLDEAVALLGGEDPVAITVNRRSDDLIEACKARWIELHRVAAVRDEQTGFELTVYANAPTPGG